MSGQGLYPTGLEPSYTMTNYNNGSGPPPGTGQGFGPPMLPGKGDHPQFMQNGPSFGGPMRPQMPVQRVPAGPPPSGGAHPTGFPPPPGAVGHHPHGPTAPAPTTQFNSMTLNDPSKNYTRTGMPPGVAGPPRSSVPPSSDHINGHSVLRGAGPPGISAGPPPASMGASGKNMPPPETSMVSGPPYRGLPATNVGYPPRNVGPPPTSLPSSMASPLPPSMGGFSTHSPPSGPPQINSIGTPSHPYPIGEHMQQSNVGQHQFTPVTSSNVGQHQYSPVTSSNVGQHQYSPVTTSSTVQHQYPPAIPSSTGQYQYPAVTPSSIGQQQYPPVTPSGTGHQQYQPVTPSGTGQQQYPPVTPASTAHQQYPPVTPSGIGQQYPPVTNHDQYQGGIHKQGPSSLHQHPQFQPPPTSSYSMPPHPGQLPHTTQAAGQFPPAPGQRQMPSPPGTDGQFPGSGPYGQQPLGNPAPPPPQQPQQQQQKRLDPDQMPSPVQVIEDDKKNRSGPYQTNTRGSVPPLVTTKFVTQDQGNASPRFIRSTTYNVPCTADTLKSTHIPFALSITPFAELGEDEQPIPLVDLGILGPVRCKRCKAYMCSFMQFIDGGRRFQCPFCSVVTDVPNEYFAHLDHTGHRVDYYNRAELCLGSYEFAVTENYCKNDKLPKEPAFIFMIDVSYNSVKSGLVQLICDKLKSEILVHLPREEYATESEVRVGIVTYDRVLHFYNVKNSLVLPQMMVVSDLEDMFVPLIDGFLVKLSESEALIDSLLTQIPQMFAETKESETILGPVIQAGLDALKSADRVGRLYIFHTGLPTVEAPGKLKNRDDRKLLGTDKEKTILNAQTPYYSKLGVDCVAAGCSVDLFLFPNQYIDVATISDICKVTSGNIFKYSYFQANIDGHRVLEDLKASVKRARAFDSTVRVRTSTGIRPVNFYGNFYMANTTDVEMASLDSDTSLCVEVKHDDKLSETEGAYIQVAILYTSVTGQRRLRCHNLSLNCCSQMADLFRNCELDVLMNFFAKQALHSSLSTNPKHVKEHITNEVAQILACYRKNCANPSSPGQLVLPECMKLLPLYANCLIKNDSISACSEISTDDRSYLMHLVNRMDVKATNVFFYPRLLPVHNLDLESSEIPVAIRCSVERLEDTGMYLLENGLSMFLWVGQKVSTDLLQKVFGVSNVSQIDADKGQIHQLDNQLSRRLCDLITQLRAERSRFLKLTIVVEGNKLQPWFSHFLVEDKGLNSESSYVDFMLQIHMEIRSILS